MSLKNLKTKIGNAIEDLATLEVASFTGPEIDLKSAKGQNGEIKPDAVFKKIKSSLLTATLVGYSRFEIEGDTINYLNSDLGDDKKHLVEGHIALVEGAQKSRKDFFDFVMKVIRT